MMARRTHRQNDDDGLQTDVMRFMAIIAFCLVAVLALVKDVSKESDDPLPMPERIPEPVIAQPEPAQPEPAPPESEQVEVEPPLLPPLRQSPQKPTTMLRPTVAEAAPKVRPAPEPVVAAEPESEPEAEPEELTAQSPTREEGLTLRFASDADFLDLIRRGQVRVYAFEERRFMVLDRGFVFRSAQPPESFHELESVPHRVRAALANQLENNRWAVRLPKRTSGDIAQLANRHNNGQLVIDRTGGVRHVDQT